MTPAFFKRVRFYHPTNPRPESGLYILPLSLFFFGAAALIWAWAHYGGF